MPATSAFGQQEFGRFEFGTLYLRQLASLLNFVYRNILDSIKSTSPSAYGVTTPNAAVTLYPEPFPLARGPAAFVMPLGHRCKPPQVTGDGRYFYGMDGLVRVRVVDGSLRDAFQRDGYRLDLDGTSYGLLRTAHDLIDKLHITIPLFDDGLPIVEEPIIITSQSPVSVYGRSNEWAYVDLDVLARYATALSPTTADLSSAPPVPSKLPDIIESIKSRLIDLAIYEQVYVSLQPTPFPMSARPAVIQSRRGCGPIR